MGHELGHYVLNHQYKFLAFLALLVIGGGYIAQMHTGGRPIEMIYTAPQEFFFTEVKLALFGAIFLAFPVIASQIYMFVAPGLYRSERHAFLPHALGHRSPAALADQHDRTKSARGRDPG